MKVIKSSAGRRWCDVFMAVAVLGVALGSFLSVQLATRLGPGLSPDSVHYISAAQNLAAGDGYKSTVEGHSELSRFPPLYPTIMSLAIQADIDIQAFIRLFNALLFASLVILLGIFHHAIEPGQYGGTILVSVIAGISTVMLVVHVMAWSEPLFILLNYFFLLCFYFYLNRGETSFLILSVLAAGAAMLVRFIGVILPLVAFPGLLVGWASGRKRQVLQETVWLSLSYVPLGIWFWQSSLSRQQLGGRELAFHPINLSHIKQGVLTISDWLQIPNGLPFALQAGILASISLILSVIAAANSKVKRSELQANGTRAETIIRSGRFLLVSFIFLYLSFLVVSISLVDANTPLDSRILSPIFPAAAILVTLIISAGFSGSQWGKTIVISLLLLLAIWTGRNFQQNRANIVRSGSSGIGFNNERWRESTIIMEAYSLPAAVQIYSNSPEAIYLYTGRSASSLPRPQNLMAQTTNNLFIEQLENLHRSLDRGSAVVIYFDGLNNSSWPGLDELTLGLVEATSSSYHDGWIIGAPSIIKG